MNQGSATPLSFFHQKAAAEMNLPVIDCSDQNPRGKFKNVKTCIKRGRFLFSATEFAFAVLHSVITENNKTLKKNILFDMVVFSCL